MSRARTIITASLLVASVAFAGVSVQRWRGASLQQQHSWETRLSLVSLKLAGRIPHVGWASVLPRLGSRWRVDGPPAIARIVARGDPPCVALWETPMGRFWGNERDGRDLDWIVMEQIGWRIYDRGAARLRQGDVVMDVGAHLGTFTRFALDRGASVVVMIEPQPTNARCLERTFAGELASRRVHLVEAAAWHTSGTLSFATKGPATMGHVDTNGTGDADVTVRATTFDDIVRMLSLSRVDFIKMDIEGAERHALAGGRDTLRRSQPRMAICIYHAPDDREVIPRVVLAANPRYQLFMRGGFQAYFH